MPKAQETVLEIDLKALKHNYEYLKSKLQPKTKFLAVIKAFAYGSDSIVLAKYLETLHVDLALHYYTKTTLYLGLSWYQNVPT